MTRMGDTEMTSYKITKTERVTGKLIEEWTATEDEIVADFTFRAKRLLEDGKIYIPGWGLDYTAVAA